MLSDWHFTPHPPTHRTVGHGSTRDMKTGITITTRWKRATQTEFRYMSEIIYAVENGTNFENMKTFRVP